MWIWIHSRVSKLGNSAKSLNCVRSKHFVHPERDIIVAGGSGLIMK